MAPVPLKPTVSECVIVTLSSPLHESLAITRRALKYMYVHVHVDIRGQVFIEL